MSTDNIDDGYGSWSKSNLLWTII